MHGSYSIFVRVKFNICFAGGSSLFVAYVNANRMRGMEELQSSIKVKIKLVNKKKKYQITMILA